jgi:hypothetical protein
VNHATTRHKSQGENIISVVIAEWSRVKNWAYFVISHEKSGWWSLFLTKPIPEEISTFCLMDR